MVFREIQRAWEAFQENGVVPATVRPQVGASWCRSRLSAIVPGRRAAPALSDAELHRRRQQSIRLVTAARPAMDEARSLLADANSMLIVTDTTAAILETEGDARAVDSGHEVRLERGGVWTEAEIGTNAIGTALASGCPVQIHAAEHFCAAVQRWTCAAAPVRDPLDGAVIGAVDISGSTDTFNPQNLAHAVALAHQIEAVMGRRAALEHDLVLRHFLGRRSLWLSEDIVAFDRSGALIYSTERALKELARRNGAALSGERLAVVRNTDPARWAERLAELVPGASLDIVREGGDEVGGVLVLHAARRHNRAPPARDDAKGVEEALPFEAIIGESAAMREARDKARRMAESGVPVLLEGETGVGKELFARAIHGARVPCGPFVPLNCGGLPRDLIASELFGYEKGAFTGADSAGRPGKLEAANGGVLCLDEIGEMPLDLQSYLLRVLEDGVVYRIGSHAGIKVSLRLVSMTNRDLSQLVAAGTFRRDLYYRIAPLRLRIPPLRERGDDVLLIADTLASATARRLGRAVPLGFSSAAREALLAYGWPGNVRELRNVVDMLSAMVEGDVADAGDLPAEILRGAMLEPGEATDLKSLEQAAISGMIEACGGNLSEAARRLGIARSTLYMRLSALKGASGEAPARHGLRR